MVTTPSQSPIAGFHSSLAWPLTCVFSAGNEGRFRPEMAFETLAKLCNTMVVNVMAERTHGTIHSTIIECFISLTP